MRTRTVVLISLSILIIISIGLSLLIKPIDDLWVENPFWNGLSEVQTSIKPLRISGSDNSQIPPENSTILMLGPSSPFSETEVTAMRNYLQEGGRVVLADDFGTGNTLLEGLGISPRFSGELLQDTLFKDREMMPRILIIKNTTETTGVKELILNYPTTLTNLRESEGLAYASYFSEVSNSTQIGPFPVFAKVQIGKGALYLISDSSIFINGMLDKGNNKKLLENLSQGTVAIDEAHSTQSRLTQFRGTLTSIYTLLDHPEVKYSLALITLVIVFKVAWEDRDEQPDEVEETLKRHPEWSRRELEELREARRRIHGDKPDTG
jgi:hypothetical protein